MDIKEHYPQKLTNLIFDHISEGDEIVSVSGETSVLFIIRPRSLSKWLTVVEWYEGTDEFSMVSVNGKAWDRMYTIMNEENRHRESS